MIVGFKKMHGLGNDFVILDGRAALPALNPVRIQRLCDRHRGVGCDQLIVLEPAQGVQADLFMRIYNPDGSEAGACGNATRCVASLVMAEKGADSCVIETISGLLPCNFVEGGRSLAGGQGGVTPPNAAAVRVNMGKPRLAWVDIPLSKECNTAFLLSNLSTALPPAIEAAAGISMGNPHCVLFCGQVEDIAVDKWGPKIEHDPLFPERTNVEFVSVVAPNHVRMRVWERGAGVTQACGSGACAAAVAAILLGRAEPSRGEAGPAVRVTLDGGDLMIEWAGDEAAPVYMTGPVASVFEGTISLA